MVRLSVYYLSCWPAEGNGELKPSEHSVSCSSCSDGVHSTVSASLPSSLPSSVQPGAVWKNMHIVAKVQGFLPPTHTRHWLPLYPAPWEESTLGMNCAWLPMGWMLPLCAVRGGPGGCGWFLSRPYLATVTFVIFWKRKKKKVFYTVCCGRV